MSFILCFTKHFGVRVVLVSNMNIEYEINCGFNLAELAQVIVLHTRIRFQATNVV